MGGGGSGVVNEDFELATLGFDMGGCGRDEGGKGYIELEGVTWRLMWLLVLLICVGLGGLWRGAAGDERCVWWGGE